MGNRKSVSRFALTLFSAVLVLAMLAGCSSAATTVAPTTAPAAPAAPTQAAAAPTEAPAAPAAAEPTAAAPAAPVATDAPAAAPAAENFPKLDKKITIGVSNNFVDSEWRTQFVQDMQDLNAKLMAAGIANEMIIESVDTDTTGQIQQVRDLMNKGVDVIVIDAGSQSALDPVIKEAHDAGIIVITADQEVTSPYAINVVLNQYDWAAQSMQWLADQLGGKGNIVVINGISGSPGNEIRYNGVKSVLAKYPDIKVLNVVNANWDEATGQQKMADLLASQPNIDGIWSQDGMAEGALRAIMAAKPNKTDKWPVMVGEARTGYLKLWKQILDTRPDFISYGVYNPPGVGADGIRIALNLLAGKKLKDGALQGDSKNTLYQPVPGFVDKDNFATELPKVKDTNDAYACDGVIDQATADSFFQP
jgi:ribose transport system substrate-binding protein